METYTFLRELADSWVLLAMTLFFLGVIGWVFRPGASAMQAEAAAIPLNDEPPKCDGACENCAAARIAKELQP